MSDLKHEARELTQGAGDVVTADRAEDRVAELDATIFRWWARRREASIEAGRAFNELKKILGHGKWQAHFAGTFAKCGISLRTAERCMKLARKADARAKIDNLSILKPANDRSAQEIKEAAQRDMAAASGRKKQTGRYSLPLHMTDDEQHAIDALRKLKDWPHAEKKIIRLLRRLCIEYGIVNKDSWRHP